MATYVLIALNGPTPGEGDADAYNRWYTEVHMGEVLATPGVVSADRYEVVMSNTPWPYVAIYQIETDDLDATLTWMAEHSTDFHPAFDRESSAHILAVRLDPPS